MLHDFVQLIKDIAVKAVDAERPSNVQFGTVISESPLKIQVDQKLVLYSSMLILSRNVTDYEVFLKTKHVTKAADGHIHEIEGEFPYIVLNALKAGEKVILIRQQGGQKYYVIDRAVS